MAERTVSVTLRAQVSQYIAEMNKASKTTREMGSEAEKLAQKKEVFDGLGKASLAMGVVAAAGVALAIAKYAEFDQAMSNVQAATQASASDQKALSDAALEAGATTVFSATESANAIEELSKAGISTADVLGGALKGSLDLASAGQLGVARAAEISATALQQFELKGSEAGHVADVLAAGAGKAMGSVEDLANGLKFVGPVANSMGISLEETTGVLALFAQQGIIGEQAGTSLRGVLASLTSPSSIARKEIEKLGITLYDSEGGFLGMENAAGELSKAYGTMDDATRDASLGVIFGRETVTAATALYQAGADGVDEWTTAVDDSGFAAQVARDRLDNLKGDVEALGGAFDTALIQTGAAGNDVLRGMTQTLTNVIDLYNQAPEPVKAVTLVTLGLTAAVGLAGAAFFLGAPKVAAFNAALATMGPNAQKAGAALTTAAGPIGVALAAAGIALAAFAGAQADAKARTDAFSDTLDEQTGQLTKSTREMATANLAAKGSFLWLETDSAFEGAEKLGLGLDLVTDAALGNASALEKVFEATRTTDKSNAEMQDMLERTGLTMFEYEQAAIAVGDAVKGSSSSIEAAVEATKLKAEADEEAETASVRHAEALDILEGKAVDATDSVSELAESIRKFGQGTLDVNSATRGFEQSIDDLSQSLIDNGATLDLTEQKGRDNQAAIDDLARSTFDLAAATVEKTGKESAAIPVMEAGRKKLIEMLGQFGITGDAAEAYADELGLIPGNVSTAVSLDKSQAQRELAAWIATINSTHAYVNVVPVFANGARATAGGVTREADGGVLDFYANGGLRENHTAQIAPAGSWRVWAEPETGGESYIPLAASKRARSLDIWEETGRRLGVAGFANGGFSQYASSSGSSGSSGQASFNIVVSSKGGVDLLKYVDVRVEQTGIQGREVKRGRQKDY